MKSNQSLSFLFAALLSMVLWAMPATATAQSEAELQKMYLRFLDKELDIEGTIDSDGDVQFQWNEHTYFIEVNEGDPEFFRVAIFNIWPIESEEERAQVLAAVDVVNRQMKVAKAYTTTSDNVWIAAEVFISEVDDYESFLVRCLNVIEEGIQVFVDEM